MHSVMVVVLFLTDRALMTATDIYCFLELSLHCEGRCEQDWSNVGQDMVWFASFHRIEL